MLPVESAHPALLQARRRTGQCGDSKIPCSTYCTVVVSYGSVLLMQPGRRPARCHRVSWVSIFDSSVFVLPLQGHDFRFRGLAPCDLVLNVC